MAVILMKGSTHLLIAKEKQRRRRHCWNISKKTGNAQWERVKLGGFLSHRGIKNRVGRKSQPVQSQLQPASHWPWSLSVKGKTQTFTSHLPGWTELRGKALVKPESWTLHKYVRILQQLDAQIGAVSWTYGHNTGIPTASHTRPARQSVRATPGGRGSWRHGAWMRALEALVRSLNWTVLSRGVTEPIYFI